MSTCRRVAICVLILAAVPLFANKRRAVSPPSNNVPAANCVNYGFARVGLKASYLSTTPNGDVNFTITYISDVEGQTKTTQTSTTAQGTATVDTTIDTERVGVFRATKHVNVKGSTEVPGLGSITSETDITFVPSLVTGPVEGWCAGATWDVAPSTETVVTKTIAGQTTNIVTTSASQGAVLAIGESVTVPAGTFQCVKYRGVSTTGSSVSPTITWLSVHDYVVVKQDTLDGSGNVTTTTVLTSLQ